MTPTSQQAIPGHRSALAFDSVWTREAVYVDAAGEYQAPSGDAISRAVSVRLEVSVTIVDDGKRSFVRLRAMVDPPVGSAAFSQLSAAVEGAFSLADGDEPDRLKHFARAQAPVLLLPYLRAVISSMTAQSRTGPIILPPINMVQIIDRMQSSLESETAEGSPRD